MMVPYLVIEEFSIDCYLHNVPPTDKAQTTGSQRVESGAYVHQGLKRHCLYPPKIDKVWDSRASCEAHMKSNMSINDVLKDIIVGVRSFRSLAITTRPKVPSPRSLEISYRSFRTIPFFHSKWMISSSLLLSSFAFLRL